MIEDPDTQHPAQPLDCQAGHKTQDLSQLQLRLPDKADALAIHQLIGQCPPLDLNSVYAYLLLSEHFRHTCVVAEDALGIQGFVSAYRPPELPDVLFIWQVAVHARARGVGLGTRMLRHLLARPSLAAIQYLHTTVGPGNGASRAMFARLAQDLNAELAESAFFDSRLFGDVHHEEERLIRIGPLHALLREP